METKTDQAILPPDESNGPQMIYRAVSKETILPVRSVRKPLPPRPDETSTGNLPEIPIACTSGPSREFYAYMKEAEAYKRAAAANASQINQEQLLRQTWKKTTL